MIGQEVNWIPECAMIDGRLSGHLSDQISAAMQRVFNDDAAVICVHQCVDVVEDAELERRLWCSACNHYSLVFGQTLTRALLDRLIGSELRLTARAETDQSFLTELDSKLELVFVAEVGKILSAEFASRRSRSRDVTKELEFCFELTESSETFTVYMTADAAARQRKAIIRRPTNSGNRTAHSVLHAVRRNSVPVGARLGSAELTLSELRTLDVGDTLIFDRKKDSVLEMMVNGMVLAEQFVELVRTESGFTLKLV